MNRALFTLVDSRGTKARLSRVNHHHQRKGAEDVVGRLGCQGPESGGLCRQ